MSSPTSFPVAVPPSALAVLTASRPMSRVRRGTRRARLALDQGMPPSLATSGLRLAAAGLRLSTAPGPRGEWAGGVPGWARALRRNAGGTLVQAHFSAQGPGAAAILAAGVIEPARARAA